MNPISYSQNILVKTPQGLAELRDRSGKLTVAERQVLILVDGKRSIKQIQQSLSTPVAETLDRLRGLGLVQTLPPMPAELHHHSHPLDDEPVNEEVMSDFSSDSGIDTGIDAFSRFEAASTHFFRTKAVGPADLPVTTPAASVAHQAATARGILFGKSYLVETLDRLLPVDGAILTRKIALINSEAALYYAFEQTIQAIKKSADPSMIHDITRRFDEAISRY
ncbi:MAG: hypothetical protein WB821_04465 [Burkholderiaceae bacterium]